MASPAPSVRVASAMLNCGAASSSVMVPVASGGAAAMVAFTAALKVTVKCSSSSLSRSSATGTAIVRRVVPAGKLSVPLTGV